MKKFILTLCLVAFGATVSAQEKPLNDTNPSKEVVATANKKACCGDTKAKTNCSKAQNTASTETAVSEIAKSEKSCCKDSKSTAVASAEDSAPVLAEKTEAVTNDKKSCCSQSSANSNCSSSGTK